MMIRSCINSFSKTPKLQAPVDVRIDHDLLRKNKDRKGTCQQLQLPHHTRDPSMMAPHRGKVRRFKVRGFNVQGFIGVKEGIGFRSRGKIMWERLQK